MQKKKTGLFLIGTLFLFSALWFVDFASASTQIIVEPGQSIQTAINNAQLGDTILIKNGSYAQYRILVNKTVTILGEHPEGSIVDGESVGDASVIFLVRANNVKISNLTVQNTASGVLGPAGIIIADALMVEISDCIIKNSATGILLTNSNSCTIEKNRIMQNTFHGIHLQSNSTNNLILHNLIANNAKGIEVEMQTKLNKIYHNNFIDNSIQIWGFGLPENKWDNGYPSGGNYWSDYVGVDIYNGQDQNITGSDGIGDAAAHTYDNYPFMGKLYILWAGRWGIDYYVLIASNSTELLSFEFNTTNPPCLKFDAIGSELHDGFCRVAIPKQLIWIEEGQSWQVFVNATRVESNITEDIDHTYVYLNYSHGTKIIQIIGTHAIPETTMLTLIILMTILGIQAFVTKKLKVSRIVKENPGD
jgi:parallel beta-helix repeat protein